MCKFPMPLIDSVLNIILQKLKFLRLGELWGWLESESAQCRLLVVLRRELCVKPEIKLGYQIICIYYNTLILVCKVYLLNYVLII